MVVAVRAIIAINKARLYIMAAIDGPNGRLITNTTPDS